jgi:hypothetical protein
MSGDFIENSIVYMDLFRDMCTGLVAQIRDFDVNVNCPNKGS